MKEIKPQRGPVGENEVLIRDNNSWLHFAEPHCVITARQLDEVLPALQQVEQRVQSWSWHAAGFVSYEAAPAFDPALQTRSGAGFPYLWFGFYSPPRRVSLPSAGEPGKPRDWRPRTNRQTYNAGIAQIKQHIAAGRSYQVNYTIRLDADFRGDPWDFFLALAQSQNHHAAYVDTGPFVICSASPELFFALDGEAITCRPMKGTTTRGRTTLEDLEQADWLRSSEKNRAENVMIVDMIRNDLGRIAHKGSVEVPELFKTERYRTLWQMTSTVTARTSASITDIFGALFPCASITGAPKVSTMRLIAELEQTPRRIYTGSIGYIAPARQAKFSVAIRTVLIDKQQGRAEYGVGGGVVWDSSSADEYAEALLKAQVLNNRIPDFSLVETMLWTPDKGFFLRDRHLARMVDSANYFDIPLANEKLEQFLEQNTRTRNQAQIVRILLNQDGSLQFETKLYLPAKNDQTLKVGLAKEPVDSNNVFLFHKTTQRSIYEDGRNQYPDLDDVLFYNESGELTEFTLGNLVIELEGRLCTPPVSCGVLPGTFRAHVLEKGQIHEQVIPVSRLSDCTRIFRINSVRKWQRADFEFNV